MTKNLFSQMSTLELQEQLALLSSMNDPTTIKMLNLIEQELWTRVEESCCCDGCRGYM